MPEQRKSLRRDNPELWAEMVATIRETVGPWTEDQIAAVMSKVRAKNPDDLLETIGRVFDWCAAAQRSGDVEAIATVEIWQTPDFPIEIMVGDEGIMHQIVPQKGD